ncbi:hypothetical protein ANN_05207 [Periplaneta americana]|uniref:Uncharacterized protein n=1 Tax=Periplaneta americana TaxID=6978 RepID=A0ABQ8TCZ6_PERAM|nr:hypothetical protein ANN_05207 [Periplaneta americana]
MAGLCESGNEPPGFLKATHLNAIDLARDRTRNLGHRRPALYQLANQVDRSVYLTTNTGSTVLSTSRSSLASKSDSHAYSNGLSHLRDLPESFNSPLRIWGFLSSVVRNSLEPTITVIVYQSLENHEEQAPDTADGLYETCQTQIDKKVLKMTQNRSKHVNKAYSFPQLFRNIGDVNFQHTVEYQNVYFRKDIQLKMAARFKHFREDCIEIIERTHHQVVKQHQLSRPCGKRVIAVWNVRGSNSTHLEPEPPPPPPPVSQQRDIAHLATRYLEDNVKAWINPRIYAKEVLGYSPDSSDLDTSDFHLFGPLKKNPAGKRFNTDM